MKVFAAVSVAMCLCGALGQGNFSEVPDSGTHQSFWQHDDFCFQNAFLQQEDSWQYGDFARQGKQFCQEHLMPGEDGDISEAGQDGGLLVMFWNLENFFDWRDDGGGSSDSEFSSTGLRRWTKSRFYAKCSGVAKTILWVGDRYGRLPDVIGVAEVENRFVVNSVLRTTALKKADYAPVHFDSNDPRGIDVALLYRRDVFEMVSAKPCRLYDSGGNIVGTRDILCVGLRRKDNGRLVYFLVNHHPSKFSGAAASQAKREAAMMRLKGICDSLKCRDGICNSLACHSGICSSQTSEQGADTVVAGNTGMLAYVDSPGQAEIIAMGDFNDTPDNPLFDILGEDMTNLAAGPFRRGEGTIRFAGKWDLIDMFIVSNGFSGYRQEILYPPFLMTTDKTHGGQKPLRTYVGPRYQGGVSDHCPVVMYDINQILTPAAQAQDDKPLVIPNRR